MISRISRSRRYFLGMKRNRVTRNRTAREMIPNWTSIVMIKKSVIRKAIARGKRVEMGGWRVEVGVWRVEVGGWR